MTSSLPALNLTDEQSHLSSVSLFTKRLQLVPVSLEMIRAVLSDKPQEVSLLCGAELPSEWPGRSLIEQAFCASLEEIEKDPAARLWGDRIALSLAEPKCIIGSVIFHGKPNSNGVIEVGYGIDPIMQGQGYASEALKAQIDWAFLFPEVRIIKATTPPWHISSARVLTKCGFRFMGTEEHEALGEVSVYEIHASH